MADCGQEFIKSFIAYLRLPLSCILSLLESHKIDLSVPSATGRPSDASYDYSPPLEAATAAHTFLKYVRVLEKQGFIREGTWKFVIGPSSPVLPVLYRCTAADGNKHCHSGCLDISLSPGERCQTHGDGAKRRPLTWTPLSSSTWLHAETTGSGAGMQSGHGGVTHGASGAASEAYGRPVSAGSVVSTTTSAIQPVSLSTIRCCSLVKECNVVHFLPAKLCHECPVHGSTLSTPLTWGYHCEEERPESGVMFKRTGERYLITDWLTIERASLMEAVKLAAGLIEQRGTSRGFVCKVVAVREKEVSLSERIRPRNKVLT